MRTPLEIALEPIRPDSHVVRVYNDGLTGLMYDESDEEAIRDAQPQILYGAGIDVLDDEATMALLRSGRLLVFGMHGDDGFDIEVMVGAPLTDAELAEGVWLQAGPCHIDLPSGRLCVHSYNSLPIGDFEPDPMTPGAVVEVPPGRYHVRLYRREWGAMEQAGIPAYEAAEAEGRSDEVIDDVIVLTPFADGEAVPDVHNVMFGDCIDIEDPGLRASRIVDGVWSGRIGDTREAGMVAIDFTEADARLLGVRPGGRLMLRADGVELHADYWGRRRVAPTTNGVKPDRVTAIAKIGGGHLAWTEYHSERLEVRAPASHPFLALPVCTDVTAEVVEAG